MSQKITFGISENKKLSILIPPVHLKSTWYFEPSEEWNKFDEVFVIYETPKICTFILNEEELQSAIHRLYSALTKCLKNTRELQLPAQCRKLGIYFNKSTKKDDHSYDLIRYWVFSTQQIQTWIYTCNKKIYLEISPSWKWLFDDPDPKDPEYISYKDFIKNYEPIAIEQISEETAELWIKQCEELLKQIK